MILLPAHPEQADRTIAATMARPLITGQTEISR
jgi:hypothetical protein